jgi:hypothetical protein
VTLHLDGRPQLDDLTLLTARVRRPGTAHGSAGRSA